MVHVWMDFQTFAKRLCAVEGGLYLKGIVKIEASVTDRIILIHMLKLLFCILTHKFFFGIESLTLSNGGSIVFSITSFHRTKFRFREDKIHKNKRHSNIL